MVQEKKPRIEFHPQGLNCCGVATSIAGSMPHLYDTITGNILITSHFSPFRDLPVLNFLAECLVQLDVNICEECQGKGEVWNPWIPGPTEWIQCSSCKGSKVRS